MSKRGQLSSEPLLWRLFALLTFSFLRGVGTTGAGNQQMKTVTRRAKKMTDTDLPWLIFGRRMRPYSFALSISTSVITWSIFAGSTIGQLLDATLGQFAGIVGIVTVLLLIGGFWFRSDRLMTIGLLLSAGLWTTITMITGMEIGFFAVSTMMAGCWAVASGGAWLLEISHA